MRLARAFNGIGRAGGDDHVAAGATTGERLEGTMKTSTTTWAAALAGAVLISMAGRAEWVAAWLAMGSLAIAPLPLAIVLALAPRRQGEIPAAAAEALARSQAEPPAPPSPPGRRAEASPSAWHARPLSA